MSWILTDLTNVNPIPYVWCSGGVITKAPSGWLIIPEEATK